MVQSNINFIRFYYGLLSVNKILEVEMINILIQNIYSYINHIVVQISKQIAKHTIIEFVI